MRKIRHELRLFLALLLRPLYFHYYKKYPTHFEQNIKQAGPLFVSAMLKKFSLFHKLMFRGSLDRIQIHQSDVQKIKEAASQGPVVYMMRNWGQVEYNFFNHLFLKENLPLATRANLLRMYWWMPLKDLFMHKLARFDFVYKFGAFPEEHQQRLQEQENCSVALDLNQETPFIFLNLPDYLDPKDLQSKELLLPLLAGVQKFEKEKTNEALEVSLIPLTFVYDHRPSHEKLSLVDILFGEKENPGTLRKMVQFFRHYKRRAVAQVGTPLSLSEWTTQHTALENIEQAKLLQSELHKIFHREQKSITGPRLKDRKRVINLLLEDKQLRQSLLALAQEQQVPSDALYLEAEKILEQIVADPNYTYIELWHWVLSWVFNNVYEGLSINSEDLQKIKDLSKKASVVLVPSHRSHVDYLLLSYIFYSNNMSVPLIAAGENLSFWPMGYIFRKSGAYFMRRSFGEDKLYALLFKTYIKTFTQQGYFHEFFIEGTRSRSGKLEQPKSGLLQMLMDIYLENTEQDLVFIPISVTYEKVLEDQSYFQENQGAQKQGESLFDLFKIGKYLKHRSGEIYIRFGEPIFSSKFCEQKGISNQLEESELHREVKKLSLEISKEINSSSIVTAPALLAAALLGSGTRSHLKANLYRQLQNLQQALRTRNVNFSDALVKHYEAAIKQSIHRYLRAGLLSEHHDGSENFYVLESHQRAPLNYYKNSLMTHIFHLCLICFLVQKFSSEEESLLHTRYLFLKELFSFEFCGQLSFTEAWADFKLLNLANNTEALRLFSGLSQDLRECYALLLNFLKLNPFMKWDQKSLITKVLQYGSTLLLKGEITRAEALSPFTLQNALQSLKANGLLRTHEKELGKRGIKIFSNFSTPEKVDEILREL